MADQPRLYDRLDAASNSGGGWLTLSSDQWTPATTTGYNLTVGVLQRVSVDSDLIGCSLPASPRQGDMAGVILESTGSVIIYPSEGQSLRDPLSPDDVTQVRLEYDGDVLVYMYIGTVWRPVTYVSTSLLADGPSESA